MYIVIDRDDEHIKGGLVGHLCGGLWLGLLPSSKRRQAVSRRRYFEHADHLSLAWRYREKREAWEAEK